MAAVISRMTTGVEIQVLEERYASRRPVFIASSSMPRVSDLPPRVSRALALNGDLATVAKKGPLFSFAAG
jgi:hypothetical protein